ncbi:22748_t:CDS:2 [Cetraspora pellucida]|uniref:22748_t:CDS:1 n=1 Tax=Cetraspora pellucida TaxID=1433469 RepID=A0A9N9AVB6_9GLOM|nr:22748_t:CDS:2 [Cetraspora pellucida]
MTKMKLIQEKVVNAKQVKYTEPSVHELKEIQENAKVQATHKKFHSNVGYKEKIEEVNSKTVLEDQLSKFVCVMTRQDGGEYYTTSVYFDLNQVINRKLKTLFMKGLGEHVKADGLTLIEFCEQWYYACALSKRKLKEYFRVIYETTDIQIGSRNISNHSGKKTAMQLLKELGYSDSVVMSITRHKSQKAPDDYNDNATPGNYDEHVVPVSDDFIFASLYLRCNDSQASLINAFDDLEVFSDGSSNVLAKHNKNVHDTDDEKEKDKDAKKNNQKEKVKGGKKDLKNLEILEKFLSENTFHNFNSEVCEDKKDCNKDEKNCNDDKNEDKKDCDNNNEDKKTDCLRTCEIFIYNKKSRQLELIAFSTKGQFQRVTVTSSRTHEFIRARKVM